MLGQAGQLSRRVCLALYALSKTLMDLFRTSETKKYKQKAETIKGICGIGSPGDQVFVTVNYFLGQRKHDHKK